MKRTRAAARPHTSRTAVRVLRRLKGCRCGWAREKRKRKNVVSRVWMASIAGTAVSICTTQVLSHSRRTSLHTYNSNSPRTPSLLFRTGALPSATCTRGFASQQSLHAAQQRDDGNQSPASCAHERVCWPCPIVNHLVEIAQPVPIYTRYTRAQSADLVIRKQIHLPQSVASSAQTNSPSADGHKRDTETAALLAKTTTPSSRRRLPSSAS